MDYMDRRSMTSLSLAEDRIWEAFYRDGGIACSEGG